MTCLVLPPHILKHLREHGSPEQRRRAQRQLFHAAQLRALRAQAASRRGVAPAPKVAGTPVYDAQGQDVLPGNRVRATGDPPTSDVMVNEAYDGAGATLRCYAESFARNSLDGLGMTIVSSVHYEHGYDNAFYTGGRDHGQMVYGDGDGDLFNRFTLALDVIGHELSHGVCEFTAGLDYQDQPGALNESNSDVLGSLVKQHALGQTAAEADWLIGAGLFTAKVQGVALRSLKAPGTAYDDPALGKDPQPATMSRYVQTTDDNGGVHVNSGILNHAFYLLATALGGHAWERAGLIWYNALTTRWTALTDFQGAGDGLHASAVARYGAGSVEAQAVVDACGQVGLRITTTPTPLPVPPLPPPAPTPSPGGSDCGPALTAAFQAARPHLEPLLRDAIARELRTLRSGG